MNVLVALMMFQGTPAECPETADYLALTDDFSEVVNFFPEPSTGIAVWTGASGSGSNPPGTCENPLATGDVWCVNPYASTLVKYNEATVAQAGLAGPTDPPELPDLIASTGLNPVALATWEGGIADLPRILVVCAGSHALFLHDPCNGDLVAGVRLESPIEAPGEGTLLSEGADIVVDEVNSWAYVSCPSANTVLRISLVTMEIEETYYLPVGQRPGPLLLDDDGTVIVAMTVTGNNTTTIELGFQSGGPSVVVDLGNGSSGPFAIAPLLDEDVYRIDPVSGTVTQLFTGAGSLLFDVERRPNSDEYWVLSSRSDNADTDLTFASSSKTEPEHRGQFLVNQLMRGTSSSVPMLAQDMTDLDFWPGPSGPYDAGTSVNQARVVEFIPSATQGKWDALIASPFSDNIISLDENGVRLDAAWAQLPQGSQCYDLRAQGVGDVRVLALCLGDMTVKVFDRSSGAPRGNLDLGFDPTPTQIRRGRGVFLDGTKSRGGRLSCASCHPRGATDQLGWSIEDGEVDTKDVMLTQSLLSIADTFPHHWRGERDLKDFQGAFDGLLGADSTTVPSEQEMDDFIVFVQSLKAPANPMQDPRRVLSNCQRSPLDPNKIGSGGDGDVAIGQDKYSTVPVVSGRTCLECHMLPTGSDSGFTAEVLSPGPREITLEVPHLRQLQHRGLDTNSVSSILMEINENGFGATHNGGGSSPDGSGGSVFDFIFNTGQFNVDPANPGTPVLTDAERVSIFRFVDQFDQGIAPAAHYPIFLTGIANTQASIAERAARIDEIEQILLPGAVVPGSARLTRTHDVVFFGQFLIPGSGWLEVRGWYEANKAVFEVAREGWPAGQEQVELLSWPALQGLLNNQQWGFRLAFMGVPPGNGRRFALDFDRDGNLQPVDTAPWDPVAFLPPGAPVLKEARLDFETARLAKYHVLFNQDVVYRVTYGPEGSIAGTIDPNFAMVFESVRGAFDASGAPDWNLIGETDFVNEDTFVLTHPLPSSPEPPVATTDSVLNPPLRDRELLVEIEAWNKSDENAGASAASLAESLGTFSPRGGGDQPPEFFHIDEMCGSLDQVTGELEVTIDVGRDEVDTNGSGFEPAVGVSGVVDNGVYVIVRIASETDLGGDDLGDTQFPLYETVPLSQLTVNSPATVTPMTTTRGFNANANPSGIPCPVYTALADSPFSGVSDYIVCGKTDSQGQTTLSVNVSNVPAFSTGAGFKVVVMGTFTEFKEPACFGGYAKPDGTLYAPAGSIPLPPGPFFVGSSGSSFQLLRREKASEWSSNGGVSCP